MIEYANLRGRTNDGFTRMFDDHLKRNGITFEQWEKRQPVPDELGESLRLRMRLLNAKYRHW